MKIGIFGGTFNPIHNGHLRVCKNLLKKHNFNLIWFVPAHRTPQKDFFPEKISNSNRLKMMKLAIKSEKLDKLVKVSTIEIENRGISYSYETVLYFRKKYPNDELCLIMGDDRFNSLNTWKNIEKIKEIVDIYVYNRIGLKEKKMEINDKRIHYVRDIIYDISSSQIIKNLEWENIPHPVKKYIAKNFLYLKAIVFYKLYNSKRFEHSLSVGSHSNRLALEHGYNQPQKAYIAGLVHDLFKNDSESKLLKYLTKNSNWTIPPTPALHGYVAALWLKKEYLIEDDEIVRAVKHHTIPTDHMNLLDKIVYVADKIAADRDNNKLRIHFLKMAYQNLDETFKKLLSYQYRGLLLSGEDIDEQTIAAYNFYVLNKFDNKKNEKNKKLKNSKFRKIN